MIVLKNVSVENLMRSVSFRYVWGAGLVSSEGHRGRRRIHGTLHGLLGEHTWQRGVIIVTVENLSSVLHDFTLLGLEDLGFENFIDGKILIAPAAARLF